MENTIVFARLTRITAVFALIGTLSAHWLVLQTVAWTAMIADQLQSTSVSQALANTFDGNHPCALCKTIATGKQSERKAEFPGRMPKLECPAVCQPVVWIAPARPFVPPPADTFADLLPQSPPTPPPRGLLA
jgi:hypothetical protein